MAKVTAPLLSFKTTGAIAKALIYRENKGIINVKQFVKPTNPNTLAQQLVRGYIHNGVNAWRDILYTAADRAAWNLEAKTEQPAASGYNRYIHYYIPVAVAGHLWSGLWNCLISAITNNGCTVKINAPTSEINYPTNWVVGDGITNLLTANQSNAETDTTGMAGYLGTLSRTTVAGEFYAGIAGFKVVLTSGTYTSLYTLLKPVITAEKYYCFSAYIKSSTIADNWGISISWRTVDNVFISSSNSGPVPASTSFTRLFVTGKAPATATQCTLDVYLSNATINDIIYAGNLMLEQMNRYKVICFGRSPKHMLDEIGSTWTPGQYTFTLLGLLPSTKYYFYIKETILYPGQRTGIYSFTTLA